MTQRIRDTRGRILIGGEVDWRRRVETRRIPPPASSDFSTVNPGSSTWTVNADKSVTLYAPAAAGPNLRCWVQTAPATPWVRVVHLKSLLTTANQRAGLLFRASGAGTLHSISLAGDGNVAVERWTSPTVLASTDLGINMTLGGDVWFAVEDDGTTNRNFYVGKAGRFDWNPIVSVGRTTHLTANQWGLFIDEGSASYSALATVFSLETSL